MVLNSGATSHFIQQEENLPVTGMSNKIVALPDGSTVKATTTVRLPFHQLADAARQAHVLPSLAQNSLISVPKLADARYTTIFHPKSQGVTVHRSDTISISQKRKPVLQGCRDIDGLWRLSCSKKPDPVSQQTESASNVYSLPMIGAVIRYLHAAAGFPVKDTWIQAIKNGHYISWPGVTVEAVNKHFPKSIETQKGHLKKQRQNVRSTKQQCSSEADALEKALAAQKYMVKVINADRTVYTDQTGRFPIQSSRGNKLLMIMFDVDANYIDAEPLPDSTETSLIKAYRSLWTRVTKGRESKPHMHILDNEASAAFKEEIRKNCTLQLVPPDTHRANLAERAIQTFKAHYIAILSGVDKTFPMELWDRLIPQTVLTLNLLRQSSTTPTTSAYQHVHGVFDYNKMPLAPLGSAVQMHENKSIRRSWDVRALNGWYLGTSPEHYRCHIIFVKKQGPNGSPIQSSSRIGTLRNQS